MPSTIFGTNLLPLFMSDSALAGATLALDMTRPTFTNAVVSVDWIWHGGWECCEVSDDNTVVSRLDVCQRTIKAIPYRTRNEHLWKDAFYCGIITDPYIVFFILHVHSISFAFSHFPAATSFPSWRQATVVAGARHVNPCLKVMQLLTMTAWVGRVGCTTSSNKLFPNVCNVLSCNARIGNTGLWMLNSMWGLGEEVTSVLGCR